VRHRLVRRDLIAFRVLQGIGGGMILPLGQGVIAQAAGPNRLGRVMAAIGIPTALGPVLGPVLGGLFVTDASWRWIFYINVPVCLAALAFSWRIMPTAKAAGRSPLDVVGMVLLSPAFAAIVYGLAEAGKNGGFGQGTTVVPLGIGAALLVAFVIHALLTKSAPIIDLRLFQTRIFATSSAVVFLAGTVLFGAMGALPLYFQQARGYTALHTGLLLVPWASAWACPWWLPAGSPTACPRDRSSWSAWSWPARPASSTPSLARTPASC
jgi:EmrB/QacA subfamily drug resistance transporter